MNSRSVPPALQEVLSLLEGEARVTAKSNWTRVAPSQWSLAIDATLSEPATEFMASRTGWHVVVSFASTGATVEIFPCASNGPTVTFPHQLHNGEPEGRFPWRTGKLCLDRPEATFSKDKWAGEPTDIVKKIIWYLSRLLLWIDTAATGQLKQVGDPFEVPPSPKNLSNPVIGFDEATLGFKSWTEMEQRWGTVSFIEIPHARGNKVAFAFSDGGGAVVKTSSWGTWTAQLVPAHTGVWLRLEKIPVVGPWGLPTIWSELNALIAEQGFDLSEVLHFAGVQLRKRTCKNENVTLLLGFPAEERLGDEPSRLHWLAIESLPLQSRHSKMRGFRPTETNRCMLDRAVARSHSRLDWVKTMNWTSDQLRRRSPSSDKLASSRIVLLGAGALGSAVAENLLRMGNCDLVILDGEMLEVGNLTRHTLGIDAVGRNKALALASSLNSSMLDGRTVGHATFFPPKDASVLATLRAADVVVDCTGADDVLRRMADFDWGTEKIFVSLAITWGGEGLLAFTASEVSFPYFDAVERMAALETPSPTLSDSTMEGIGCWHPIFPATAEDMRFWGALGTRVIRNAIERPVRELSYYRRHENGEIKLVGANV